MKFKRITTLALAGCMIITNMFSGFYSAEAVTIGKATSADTYITAKDWPEGPSVEAGSAVLLEADTGTVLYAKNPDTPMYPASITKIMTALLTLENFKMDDTITYSAKAYMGIPYGYVQVPVIDGEEISVEASLHTLLLYSANDVANGLGLAVCDSIEEYADLMNKRAKELGCKHTHFRNPSGLEDDDHYTTAYDMCMIMKECIKYDDFNRIGGTRIYTLEEDNKRRQPYTFVNKHSMLFPNYAAYYEPVVCGKTGYTEPAKNTLVTYAEKDGMKLICCVMKCGHGVTYSDTRKLFEYGFENFSSVDAKDAENGFTLSDVGIFSSEVGVENLVDIEVEGNSTVVVPSGVSFKKLETEISYLDQDKEGCFADITYAYEGMRVGSARLKMKTVNKINGSSVLKRENPEEDETEGIINPEILNQTATTLDVRLLGILAGVILLLIIGVIIVVARRKDDRIRYHKRRR